jgi:hypothetical protein
MQIQLKLINFLLFSLFSSIAYAQHTLPNREEKIVINDTLIAKPGECYVDGIKIELDKVIIHENNLEDIKVYKGESSKIYSGGLGATIIKRKKNYDFVLLSKFVADLKKEPTNLKEEQTIEIIVDGRSIEHPEEYTIELNPEIKTTIQVYADDGVYHGGTTNKPAAQLIIDTKM